MKRILAILVFIFGLSVSANGQINADSLYQKAQMGIYENPDQSIKIANELLDTEKDLNRKVNLYLIISNANISKRNFDESLKYILKAKELLNETNAPNTKINILTSIAAQYQQMELFGQSLETLDEAESILKQTKQYEQQNFDLGKIFAIRGMIYKSQNNSELALSKFLTSIRYFLQSKQNKPSFANTSIVLYNIGYAYLDLNRPDDARKNFIKSVEYARKADAKSLEAFSLKGLADTYTLNGENEKALQLFQQAEILSRNVGDLVLNEGIYKGMSDNYLILNQQENYRKYNEKYLKTRFEREQSELKSINSSIDNQYMEAENKKNSLAKSYSIANTAVILCTALLGIFLLWKIFKLLKFNSSVRKKIQELIQ